MLSATERKFLTALHRKKEREAHRLFLVEGTKLVGELLDSGWRVERVLATPAWIAGHSAAGPVAEVTEDELARVSAMETPNQVLAVAHMPAEPAPAAPAGLTLALDGVQDPGNMGTILRIADWFGVSRIVCSPDCVERFNPKVVQASMGSIFRVSVQTGPLEPYLRGLPGEVDVAGACMDGDNLYNAALPEPAVAVLGNEARGISPALQPCIRRKLTIPRLGRAESLNVAVAAALLCGEWRRPALAGARPLTR